MNWDDFNQSLARRIATSSRDGIAVLAQQVKGIITEIVSITPPGHQGVPGGTPEAQLHGQTKVADDIAKLYGAPSAAFDAIRKLGNRDEARAFWKLHNQGDQVGAARIVKDTTGNWYGPFDGGKLHDQQFKRGRVAGSTKRPVLYISNPGELEAFVKLKQNRVHFLAAGWKEIATKLGISLPQMITHNEAPGSAVIEIGTDRLRIVATNAVSYASDADLERRLQWAIDRQDGKMRREWQTYCDNLLTL